MATKKPAAKKAAPAKKIAKPVAKAAPKKAAPKKAAAKPVAKPAHKPVAKAATPKKAVKAAPKPVAKPARKPVPKPVAKPAPKPAAKAAPVKPAPVVKKEAEKKHAVVVKPVVTEVKTAPVAKAPPAPPKPAKQEPPKEVKVPKTTVKTSVPYQPGYTPLEKRTDSPKTNEPLVRYSDSDLGEFRDLINKKLEAAKKELAYLQGLITRKDDMGGDETDNRYMTMEDGSMSMEREQLSQMASRQITYIDHLEKALIRIENKTYGICRVTGKLIDKARLRAVPHATLSLEAKLGLVKPGTE
jgi:RNA polymerase-binding transcription factor DksA